MFSELHQDNIEDQLRDAASRGDVDTVIKMIEADKKLLNKDISLYNNKRFSAIYYNPLEIAAMNGQANLVKVLVEKGGVIDKKLVTSDKLTAEVISSLKGVKYKLIGMPPLNPREPGISPGIRKEIEFTYDGSNLNLVQAWIDHDPNCINQGEDDLYKPISTAIYHGCAEAVKMLLVNGSILPHRALVSATSRCEESHCLDILKVLVEFGASHDANINADALHHAIHNKGRLVVIEYLLTLKINWKYLVYLNQTLIQYAFNHRPNFIIPMVKAGSDINQVNRCGYTLMHLIASEEASNSQLEKLKILFECNADPTLRLPDSNMTPYQLAYTQNNHIIAQHIADYQKTYKGNVDSCNTVQSQLEQIKKLNQKKRPRTQPDNGELAARLEILEVKQRQLQSDNKELVARLEKLEAILRRLQPEKELIVVSTLRNTGSPLHHSTTDNTNRMNTQTSNTINQVLK